MERIDCFLSLGDERIPNGATNLSCEHKEESEKTGIPFSSFNYSASKYSFFTRNSFFFPSFVIFPFSFPFPSLSFSSTVFISFSFSLFPSFPSFFLSLGANSQTRCDDGRDRCRAEVRPRGWGGHEVRHPQGSSFFTSYSFLKTSISSFFLKKIL